MPVSALRAAGSDLIAVDEHAQDRVPIANRTVNCLLLSVNTSERTRRVSQTAQPQPFHFQDKARRGACGKTRVVRHALRVSAVRQKDSKCPDGLMRVRSSMALLRI